VAVQIEPIPAKVTEQVNILLVDDQPAKLLTYEAILRDLGENLVKATSAREALQQLLKRDFAVILVDVCMPEQDGFELVEMIRSHHRMEQTAIIFVSAVQLTDIDLMRGYAKGAVDYVSVPVVPAILRAKVAIFVDLYRKTRQLERMNEDLERHVQERTSELRDIEQALMESNRRKDEFLALLAHELRNPLAPMQSSLDLLHKAGPSEEVVKTVEDVWRRQLAQMTRLIDDLMDISRITRNSLELRVAETSVDPIIANAVECVQSAIDQARQTLSVTSPERAPMVNGDAARLAQVLSNLLNNASKYTQPGGNLSLTVTENGGEIEFSVRDDGVGLAPDDLARVFEPFQRVGAWTDQSKGGLGIGLTLVKTIVESHGGSVKVSSAGLGKGSEFSIIIPSLKGRSRETANKVLPQEETVPEGKRILVVDDNRDAAQMMKMLLSHLGHTVEVANDGRGAVRIATGFRPSAILMDIGMPEMDGYEAARTIRNTNWGKEVFLIALTGWGQKEDRAKSENAGFDLHLVKPAGLAEISKALEQLDKKCLTRPS
jgi:signal transduction histidine kinase